MSELDRARAQAAQLRELEEARARLPELEREAEVERVRQAAEIAAADLAGELDAEIARFRVALADSDRALAEVLAELAAVVRGREQVSGLAERVSDLARRWGAQAWRSGNPGALPGVQVRYEVEAAGAQYLIDAGFRGGRLLTVPRPGDDLQAEIADVLAPWLGEVEDRGDVSPFRGRTLVERTGPDGQKVRAWE